MPNNRKPPEIIYKGRKPKVNPPDKIKVELEDGTIAEVTLCPTRYLVKSKQYTLDKKNGG